MAKITHHSVDNDMRGYANIKSGLEDVKSSLAEKAKQRMTIKDLVEPFFIPHRGSANVYPDSTIDAYEAVVATGIRMLEVDVKMLSDGNLVAMHDTTVDRTTDGTGNVTDFHSSAWKKLNVDATNFMAASGYENTKAPFIDEIFRKFGDSVIYLPESESTSATTTLIDLINKHKLKDNVIFQSFDIPCLQLAVNAGITTMALGDSVNLQTVKNMGVKYVGHTTSVTDQYIADIISNSLKSVPYIVNLRYDWDRFKAKGCVGCFSDDALYVSGSDAHVRTTDPFKFKTWYHGTISTKNTRGEFIGTNKFGFVDKAVSCVLQGWASPIAKRSQTYSIDLKMTFDVISSNTTCFGSIGFGCVNDSWADSFSVTGSGYNLLLRANGTFALYRITNGVATNIGQVTSSALTNGQTATIKITVTPSSITATRTDVGAPNSITVNDTTYRGGYLFLNHNPQVNPCTISFSDVVIS